MITVYRVQDAKGRGPFQPGFSETWADEEWAPGMQPLPTFMDEFGWDLIDRLGRPGEYYGSAVRTPAGLLKWFSAAEARRLDVLGFGPVSLRADRILAESGSQLVFARRAPLRVRALILAWPHANVEATTSFAENPSPTEPRMERKSRKLSRNDKTKERSENRDAS